MQGFRTEEECIRGRTPFLGTTKETGSLWHLMQSPQPPYEVVLQMQKPRSEEEWSPYGPGASRVPRAEVRFKPGPWSAPHPSPLHVLGQNPLSPELGTLLRAQLWGRHLSPCKPVASTKCHPPPRRQGAPRTETLVHAENDCSNNSKATLERKSVPCVWGLRAFRPPC